MYDAQPMPRMPNSRSLLQLEARVTELELRFMEQRQVLEALDDVVREQDRRIQSLELRLRVLLDWQQQEPSSQED